MVRVGLRFDAKNPVYANIIGRSKCVDPTVRCTINTALDVEFKFTDEILGEAMTTPASQKCGEWRVSSSTPNDLTLAGTPPSDVLFDADDIEFALCLVAIAPNRSLSVPPRRATFSSPNLSDLQHNPK